MTYAHRVESGSRVDLSEIDARDAGGTERSEGKKETETLVAELVDLQQLLYAAGEQSLLVILQGRDTSGKDGLIRRVAGPLDSRSCDVAYFRAPSQEELAHDFLWRVHARAPALGRITFFNRSHYEDVLVARVHGLVPEEVWRRRYEHINAFEKMLADAGTIVVKLFLHISREEQEERLLAREKDDVKAWKLAVGDWEERERWDEYTAAYEEVIGRCSTDAAPWYVVPADRKWFRDLAAARVLRDALLPFRDGWLRKLEGMGKARRKELEEYRRAHHAGDD
jgi:PPK2 family polyphosphate:nucleotide phosphotransferase